MRPAAQVSVQIPVQDKKLQLCVKAGWKYIGRAQGEPWEGWENMSGLDDSPVDVLLLALKFQSSAALLKQM